MTSKSHLHHNFYPKNDVNSNAKRWTPLSRKDIHRSVKRDPFFSNPQKETMNKLSSSIFHTVLLTALSASAFAQAPIVRQPPPPPPTDQQQAQPAYPQAVQPTDQQPTQMDNSQQGEPQYQQQAPPPDSSKARRHRR